MGLEVGGWRNDSPGQQGDTGHVRSHMHGCHTEPGRDVPYFGSKDDGQERDKQRTEGNPAEPADRVVVKRTEETEHDDRYRAQECSIRGHGNDAEPHGVGTNVQKTNDELADGVSGGDRRDDGEWSGPGDAPGRNRGAGRNAIRLE